MTIRRRQGWRAYYAAAGASLRSIPDKRFATLANCWVARRVDVAAQGSQDQSGKHLVVATMRKLLARGLAPPLHPDAERRLLESQGLADRLVQPEVAGDVGPRLRPPHPLAASDFAVPGRDTAFDDGMTDPNSHGSEDAFVEWVAHRAPTGMRWLIPQPSLDLLVKAGGGTASPAALRPDEDLASHRRADFLFAPPGITPTLVEVDGQQHEEQNAEDRSRHDQLRAVGIQTIRVRTSELRAGAGPGLEAVGTMLQRCPEQTTKVKPLVWATIQVHRLVLGICEALEAGWLSGGRWHIELRDPTALAADLIEPYLGLLDALDCLWGNRTTAPPRVEFACGDRRVVFERVSMGRYEASEISLPSSEQSDVHLRLDCDSTPSEPMPDCADIPMVVIRSTGVPMLISDNPPGLLARTEPFASCESDEVKHAAIKIVLRAVFAKERLREGQVEAITEVLAGRDCAVLLPTGAGKSMIYQLSGLCLPGTTLVVDPLVALMEDQVDGLRRYGIDRAVDISSRTKNFPREPGDSYFIFVTPERLQRQQFRNELRAAAQTTPVNLAVVDEAHCVTEWGHDFRPAYLNFGTTLRRECNGALGEPPLLALTGTASRPVLRDVLYQLGIDHEHENSIVRPSTFDRPELSYHVVLANPDDREARLEGELRGMPGRFREVSATFFEPSEDNTYSGIVFVPTVRGRHGVTETWEEVRRFANTAVRYSGKAPNGFNRGLWDQQKIQNAQDFKENRASVIVTTKAFGMGIDKPNIRWVIHYGLPGSIEAFYQEVGRAGRDGERAWSVWILTDRDRDANERLLRTGGISGRRDDVDTALYFHNSSFPSEGDEHRNLLTIFDRLEANDRRVPLGFAGGSNDSHKRALHRLSMLSLLDDYCLEGAGQSEVAVVQCRERTPADVVDGLLRFVERSVPGRLEAMRAEADTNCATLRDAVDHCGRLLIRFVYETIEGARRRSLREMWLIGGEAESDGEILRERILEYLTEGDIARLVEELAERRPFTFDDWQQAWAYIGPGSSEAAPSLDDDSSDQVAGILVAESDAQEWRSAAARLLASYPDHPGLLASRGVSEAMLSGGDLREFEQNLDLCLVGARDSYGVSRDELERFVRWLLRLVTYTTGDRAIDRAAQTTLERSGRTPAHLAAGLVGTAQRVDVASDTVGDWLDANWDTGVQLSILKLAASLDSALELASSATTRWERGGDGRV